VRLWEKRNQKVSSFSRSKDNPQIHSLFIIQTRHFKPCATQETKENQRLICSKTARENKFKCFSETKALKNFRGTSAVVPHSRFLSCWMGHGSLLSGIMACEPLGPACLYICCFHPTQLLHLYIYNCTQYTSLEPSICTPIASTFRCQLRSYPNSFCHLLYCCHSQVVLCRRILIYDQWRVRIEYEPLQSSNMV
jgi:hypothetical protein